MNTIMDELKKAAPLTSADEDKFPPENDRPCWRVYDDWITRPEGKRARPGVYWHAMTRGTKNDPPAPVDNWACGPLHVRAQTRDDQGNNFGRLLRFQTTAGNWCEWAMPQELVAGDGTELRRELLSMGLQIASGRERGAFIEYLNDRVPHQQIQCATRVGWHGRDAFVLPDTVIGAGRDGVIFQSGERLQDEYTQAGTLAGWQRDVSQLAAGNPMLTLGLSAAFAGPVLELAQQEAGGIHLVGDSSSGKSTILEAARSVWGSPSFKRSWRSTSNGLEGVAALHNDCLLPLDELSECDPREVGAIVYMLGNGQGKSRATRSGGARQIRRWKTFVLSTGERTLEATMAEAGQATKAGQAVRLLDVVATRQFGVFDHLGGFDGGRALADAIKQGAADHYGTAGRQFLVKLAADTRDFGEMLEHVKKLPVFQTNGASGQESRAAGRFALIGMAGELAIEYGITGWPNGAAIAAAAEGFRLWREHCGQGNAEPIKIVESISDFIEKHGDSRFSNIQVLGDNPHIRDRAGYWEQQSDGSRVYYFTSAGMKEALKGYDLKRALKVLAEFKAIPAANDNGRHSIKLKPSESRRALTKETRLYPIHPDLLEARNHGA